MVTNKDKFAMKASSLADNIQMKLNQQKISISEFERSAGLKRSAVANILTGKSKNPTIEVVISIAKRLGCTVEDLIGSGESDKGSRSIDVNPETLDERKLFIDIGVLLLNKLDELGIQPSFTNFTNCFKEIFFYATHSHKNRFKEEDFLLWIIKSHFPNRGSY